MVSFSEEVCQGTGPSTAYSWEIATGASSHLGKYFIKQMDGNPVVKRRRSYMFLENLYKEKTAE